MIELNFTKADLLKTPHIGKMTADAMEVFLLEHGYMLKTNGGIELDKAVAMLRNSGYKVELPKQPSNAD